MRIELNSGGLSSGAIIQEFQSNFDTLIHKSQGVVSAFKKVTTFSCNMNGGTGCLQSAVDEISSRIQVDEAKSSTLERINQKATDFIGLARKVDLEAGGLVNQNKNEFYDVNPWSRPPEPEREKKWYEKTWDWVCDRGREAADSIKKAWTSVKEWCSSNVGKIVLGIVAVVGAIAIIAAVIASGGLALVPLLTALGCSAGLATGISMTVGAVAVVSTALALIPNSLDLAAAVDEVVDPESNKISDFNNKLHQNEAYNTFQKTANITSAVSGGIYSIGSAYNATKGITNADLKQFKALQSEGYRPGWGSHGQEVNYLSDYYPGSDAGINRSLGMDDFYSVTNSNGGTIHVSTAPVDQYSFTDIVQNAKGQVNILSGTHGDIDGMFLAEKSFLAEDLHNWGSYSNIAVMDVTKLSQAELTTILNSNSTTICAWCYSERSLAVLQALGLK